MQHITVSTEDLSSAGAVSSNPDMNGQLMTTVNFAQASAHNDSASLGSVIVDNSEGNLDNSEGNLDDSEGNLMTLKAILMTLLLSFWKLFQFLQAILMKLLHLAFSTALLTLSSSSLLLLLLMIHAMMRNNVRHCPRKSLPKEKGNSNFQCVVLQWRRKIFCYGGAPDLNLGCIL